MAKVEEPKTKVRDPICGKAVLRQGASVDYKKKRYHFCSEKCRRDFLAQTERHRLKDLARVGALFSPGKVRWGIA